MSGRLAERCHAPHARLRGPCVGHATISRDRSRHATHARDPAPAAPSGAVGHLYLPLPPLGVPRHRRAHRTCIPARRVHAPPHLPCLRWHHVPFRRRPRSAYIHQTPVWTHGWKSGRPSSTLTCWRHTSVRVKVRGGVECYRRFHEPTGSTADNQSLRHAGFALCPGGATAHIRRFFHHLCLLHHCEQCPCPAATRFPFSIAASSESSVHPALLHYVPASTTAGPAIPSTLDTTWHLCSSSLAKEHK